MLNAYTFIFALICEAAARHHDYYNIGTVLFTSDDVNKQRWNMHDIILLRAREHFINLIPPPQILNMQNENLARSFLTYFQDSITTLKRECSDAKLQHVMMTALTDTLGGYMQKWVLPIVKYSYYGGTVSQNDAMLLFDFHDRIKKFLKTDGKGWHKPSVHFLNSVTVSVAPVNELRQSYTRSTSGGCDGLAYFEKTSSGLTVPVPSVNWDRDSESMFIPLKNDTLISLNSPNASDSLINYYITARTCIESNNIESYTDFENRLQKWLLHDVIPHLSDEKLYPALKSVLTLVNKTRNLCDTVIDLYTSKDPKICKKTRIAGFIPIDLSSKKMMVITIIIILEIVWCIPTLCYLMCTKMKKKNTNSNNNVYFFIESKKKSKKLSSGSTQCSVMSDMSISGTTMPKSMKSKGLMTAKNTKSVCLGETPKTKGQNIELMRIARSGHSIGTCTRSNFTCQSNSINTPTFEQGTGKSPPQSKFTSSMKDLLCDTITRKHSSVSLSNELSSCITDKEAGSKTASFITVQELQPTKTVTILRDKGVKSKHSGTNVDYVNENTKTLNRRSSDKIKKDRQDNGSSRPVSSSHSKKKLSEAQPEKSSKTAVKDRSSTHIGSRKTSAPPTRTEEKPKKYSKGKSGPVLEITIDNPNRDIVVDISGPQLMNKKPSKIPKRYFNNNTQTTWVAAKKEVTGRKSCIPHLNRQVTVDDFALKDKKSSEADKLNVTL